MTKQEMAQKLDKQFLDPFRTLLIIQGCSMLFSPIIMIWFSFMLFIKIFLTILIISLATIAVFKLFEHSIKVVMDRYKDDEVVTKENWHNKPL